MTSLIERLKIRLCPGKRLAHDVSRMMRLRRHGMKIGAKLMSNKIFYRYGCCISPNADISSDVVFPHPTGIVIGEGVTIGRGCIIYQQVTVGRKVASKGDYPVLGESCVLYAGSSVLGGVVLADRVVVGANSLVTHSCRIPGAILAGSPSKMLN